MNYNELELERAKQIMRQGELQLQAQLQVLIASDYKAVALGSCYSIFGVTLLAATVTSWSTNQNLPILIGGLFGVIHLSVCSALCFLAAKPIRIRTCGNVPKSWIELT